MWGTKGSEDGQFFGPKGITVDFAGNVYVVDSENNRIQKFDSSGTFIAKWGSYGSGNGEFAFPKGIVSDVTGKVYVVDGNHRIQAFDEYGTFLTKWGMYGSGDGQFRYPRDIAIDAAGCIYVTDTGNSRIQKFNSSGMFVNKWDTKNGLTYIATDPIGGVYAVDSSNNQFWKYDVSGVFLGKWGASGSGDGQFRSPKRIAVDAKGNVYIADSDNKRIQVFSQRGEPLPKASFSSNTTSGHIPLTVQFYDTSTGNPIAWFWTFGDGNTSTEQHPVHIYRTPGNYTVNLTVSTADGSDTLPRPGYITVTRVTGDFNGDGVVDIGDVSRVAYMVVGKAPADPAADFNENGAVDIGDAAKIAYYFVGRIVEL